MMDIIFMLEITIKHGVEGCENPWMELLFALHLILNYKAYTEKLPEVENHKLEKINMPLLITQIK